jgi:hypothetical protein
MTDLGPTQLAAVRRAVREEMALHLGIVNQDQILKGDLVIRDANNVDRIRLDRETGSIFIRDSSNNLVCHLEMPGQNLRLGGHGRDGDLLLFRRSGDNLADDGKAVMNFDADSGVLRLGGDGAAGRIVCRNTADNQTVLLDGGNGRVIAGGNGQDGELRLNLADGGTSVRMRAQGGNPGPVARLEVGGNGASGAISVVGKDNVPIFHLNANGALTLGSANADGTIHLRGERGEIRAGDNGANGTLLLDDGQGRRRITLDAGTAAGRFGGAGKAGHIVVLPANAPNQTAQHAVVHIDGDRGDIILRNADCAEDFEVASTEECWPGTVVVFGTDGRLYRSDRPYDVRVAGVVSGAGGTRPGIVMGHDPADAATRRAIALAGKVFCRVDARSEPIVPGDLLTTGEQPGCAMKVTDRERSFGAVIGKALAPLAERVGLIPMLVALQ